MTPNKKEYIIWVLIPLLSFLSISSQGIWIDEAIRIACASVTIENGFFDQQWALMQMGLANIMYIWEVIFGRSEFASRCMNIPFLMIAAVYLVRILRHYKLSAFWVLLLCVHPMISYYLNDAGPYLALLACSCGMYYHSFFTDKRGTWSNSLFLIGWFLLGYSIHFIFGFAGIVYLFSLIRWYRQIRSLKAMRREFIIAILSAPFFLYITYMYLQYMQHGIDRGWETPGILNIGVVIYSFLGLAGLGLPRNDMRSGDLQLITPFMITAVSLNLLMLGIIVAAGFKRLVNYLKSPMVLSALALAAGFYVAAASRNFQFWERHLMFTFPAFFLILVVLLQNAWNAARYRWLFRGAVIIYTGLLLFSSAQLRWNYDYQKEDIKGVYNYLNTHSILHSNIPVLMQGGNFLHYYYACTDPRREVPTPARNIALVEAMPQSELIRLIEQTSPANPTICLVLCRKTPATLKLYQNAEQFFSSLGYSVEANNSFNGYKILILRRKASPFSPFAPF